MASLNHLANELVVMLTKELCGDALPWSSLNAFAQTNRRFYDIANPILYEQAVTRRRYVALYVAAQDGNVGTLKKLLAAGLAAAVADFDGCEWQLDDIYLPDQLKIGRWAGRTRSINNLDGYVGDSPNDVTLLRVSTPYVDRDQSLFDQFGKIKSTAQRNDQALLEASETFPHRDMLAVDDHWQRSKNWEPIHWSPLHAAAANGHLETAELLLDNGFDINAKAEGYCWCQPTRCYNEEAQFPVESASQTEIYEFIEHVRENGLPQGPHVGRRPDLPSWSPLHHALCHGQTAMAQMLLSRSASIQVDFQPPSRQRITALHQAAGLGNLDIVKYLVDSGKQTDLDVQDPSGFTPVYWALRGSHHDTTLRWLVEHGANINTYSHNQGNLLSLTISYGYYHDAGVLLDLGASLRPPTSRSPLNEACRGALRHHKLNIAAREPAYAALSGRQQDRDPVEKQRIRLIHKLVAKGADLEHENRTGICGYTALENAIKYHLVGAAKCLLAAGARLRLMNIRRALEDCCQVGGRITPCMTPAALDMLALIIDHPTEDMSKELKLNTALHTALSCAATASKIPNGIGRHAAKIIEMGWRMVNSNSLESLPPIDDSAMPSIISKLQIERSAEVVRFLLRKGADPSFCDRVDAERGASISAFQHACATSNIVAANLMLTKPDYSPNTTEIENILNHGLTTANVEEIKFVLDLYPTVLEHVSAAAIHHLLFAYPEKCVSVLDALLDAEPLLFATISNITVSDLNKLLHTACSRPSPDRIVQKLIEAGANVNHSCKGEMPLLLAMKYNDDSAMRVLLEAGADILQHGEIKGRDIREGECGHSFSKASINTAIGYAIDTVNPWMLDLLFEYNPYILRDDPRAAQHRFLHLATNDLLGQQTWNFDDFHLSDRIVAQLIRHGADPTVLDDSNCSPLGHVMRHGLSRIHCNNNHFRDAWEVYLPRLIRMLWHPSLDMDLKCNTNRYSIVDCVYEILASRGSQTWEYMVDAGNDELHRSIQQKRDVAAAVSKTVRLVPTEDGTMTVELLPISF